MSRHPASVRLVVDASRCDGHGICALRCPEMVNLDEWGYAQVTKAGASTPDIAARARRAARACPAGALQVVAVARNPGPG